MFSGQIVIPRGLIKWHKRKEKSADTFFNLEVSEDSVHGKGIIQVLDAKESGLDISKVTCQLQVIGSNLVGPRNMYSKRPCQKAQNTVMSLMTNLTRVGRNGDTGSEKTWIETNFWLCIWCREPVFWYLLFDRYFSSVHSCAEKKDCFAKHQSGVARLWLAAAGQKISLNLAPFLFLNPVLKILCVVFLDT